MLGFLLRTSSKNLEHSVKEESFFLLIFNSNLSLKSYVFGSLEEMMKKINKIDFPIVLKEPKGALSRGVYLAKTKNDLIKLVKKITKTNYFFHNLKDDLRSFKHDNYIKESKNLSFTFGI